MLLRALSILCLLHFSFASFGEEVRIGLFRYYKAKSFHLSINEGKFQVYADSQRCQDVHEGISYDVYLSGGKLKLLRGVSVIGLFDTIQIKDAKTASSFKIKLTNPSKPERKYKGGLFLTATESEIIIVNEVDISDYLAGVIESEGGGGRHIEYYKVQAILSRTYVKRNHGRHASEGFQLCDRVHCQAYHHMLQRTPTIYDAVYATDDEVMVDTNFHLAQGYFHANCGGQTSESHYVWNKAIPYLWSVKDTFCIKTHQANWTKKISKSSWKSFLVSQYGFPVNDSLYGKYLYNFEPKEREAFYGDQRLGIPLRDLREKFDLKSTYFSCKPEGDYVVLSGRGFGHGIGLCQEGAMNMAKAGYTYKQILKFYFQGILIGKYKEFQYFQHADSFE
ncbi:MAG: SpoIID/LytB domain-containing protein [Crocinitomicaceae bacterium]